MKGPPGKYLNKLHGLIARNNRVVFKFTSYAVTYTRECLSVGRTKTSSFGVSKRESHDSSVFYSRELFKELETPLEVLLKVVNKIRAEQSRNNPETFAHENWMDRIYCQSSENMYQIPDESIALALTSPPYNNGKDYDRDLTLSEYLLFLTRVGREVYRVLKRGGRYVINIANLGRKPYVPLHSFIYMTHMEIGFKPAGEIIWQKGKGANGNCAWGSWLSARSPRIRDIHEYLLVFVKEDFCRSEKGGSTLTRDEFLSSTLSIWEIRPVSAKKTGHPAPFPVELAERVIRLFSYVGDVVLDPFAGSGTTCVAAVRNRRHYVRYEIVPEYCQLAEERIRKEKKVGQYL